MSTNVPNVQSETLQKLVDWLASAVTTPVGYLRPAPGAFSRSDGSAVQPNGSMFSISIRSSAFGGAAHVVIDVPSTNGPVSIMGELDLEVLAEKLT